MDVEIKLVKTRTEKELVLSIRKKVFIRELNIPKHIEIDSNEGLAKYILAFINNNPVGTARWRETDKGFKLERFAVLKSYRHNGIGRKMTSFILSKLDKSKFVYLNAQVPAVNFYEKLGFTSVGSIFVEARIRHQKMIFTNTEDMKPDTFPS